MSSTTDRIDLPSYEESIRARAAAHGHDVIREGGGLTVLADDGTEAWHRLGGAAEALHDRRHDEGGRYLEPGRWCKINNPQAQKIPLGSMDWVPAGQYW